MWTAELYTIVEIKKPCSQRWVRVLHNYYRDKSNNDRLHRVESSQVVLVRGFDQWNLCVFDALCGMALAGRRFLASSYTFFDYLHFIYITFYFLIAFLLCIYLFIYWRGLRSLRSGNETRCGVEFRHSTCNAFINRQKVGNMSVLKLSSQEYSVTLKKYLIFNYVCFLLYSEVKIFLLYLKRNGPTTDQCSYTSIY